ncbi:MAG: hypothetical protein A3J70_04290 [Elusimicrobia bacterium RIFCSPHIGHO2_02_FULL_61_10]|nr:MAG: hypothetical protein A3J70_04290 [Elusimicrobia bacterium RIFCSPHIGHO2_02_FULL_61_10]
MDKERLKKAWLAAAIAAAGIIAGIVFYTVVVEVLRGMGYKPPLQPPAADAAKYALYCIGVSALAVLKMAEIKLGGKKESPEATVKALTTLAIVRAALCELPAIAGLLIFLLTGKRLDFYLLVVFSVGLEIYNFPRLAQWEERIRGDFGQI